MAAFSTASVFSAAASAMPRTGSGVSPGVPAAASSAGAGVGPQRTARAALSGRPARVVAAWAGLVIVTVMGSSLYLSLLVHTALAWRTLDALTQELERERRRGEQLEVQLARVLAPASTEQAARALLAMDRPRQVDLVVVDARPAQASGHVSLAALPDRASPRTALAPAAGGSGWVARARAALSELLGNSMALARRLPQWP
ncbi:MAG TPA: hypothetical protein VIK90_06885 [Limnochordales bacterium]